MFFYNLTLASRSCNSLLDDDSCRNRAYSDLLPIKTTRDINDSESLIQY